MKETVEDTIEVRDPIKLDELINKENYLIIDYSSTSLEEKIKRSGNYFARADLNCSMFKIPRERKGQKVLILVKIFSGLYHRDILAEMENEGFFGGNIFEGTELSAKFSKLQHQITFYTPAERSSDCDGNVYAICFSANKYGKKIISREIIYFNDKKKNIDKIYLLGTKIIKRILE